MEKVYFEVVSGEVFADDEMMNFQGVGFKQIVWEPVDSQFVGQFGQNLKGFGIIIRRRVASRVPGKYYYLNEREKVVPGDLQYNWQRKDWSLYVKIKSYDGKGDCPVVRQKSAPLVVRRRMKNFRGPSNLRLLAYGK